MAKIIELENNEVLLEVKENIGIITLNRPNFYNAITANLNSGLKQALSIVQSDPVIQAIILTGAGKGFCAGADISQFNPSVTKYDVRNNLITEYGSVVRRIFDMDKPVISAINGPVAGAGIGFALAADYKLMADTASLRYAFINIALSPDAGSSWFLTRTVGYTKAMEIIIGGEKIPASECADMGIINSVYQADKIMDAAMELAKKLALKAPLAFAATKRILNHAMTNPLFSTFAKEAEEQMNCILTKDNVEGVTAFMEKRTPVFKGE